MPEQFDPYYHWLGIPPQEQPPNHYRLLSLQLYEPNEEVIQHAVDRAMAGAGVRRLIHGHTHRPATHRHELADGSTATRIVLADWYDRGSYLEVTPDGRLTGKAAGPVCVDVNKKELMLELAHRIGLDLQNSYAYGNHPSDLPLLESVRHPHAVTPHSRLEKIARQRSWPILGYR